MFPPTDILRNKETLEAWRAYSLKANAPLFYALFPMIIVSGLMPVMVGSFRHQHTRLGVVIFLIVEVLVLAGLIVAAFKVAAYKRAHPFVPPPRVTWSEPPR